MKDLAPIRRVSNRVAATAFRVAPLPIDIVLVVKLCQRHGENFLRIRVAYNGQDSIARITPDLASCGSSVIVRIEAL